MSEWRQSIGSAQERVELTNIAELRMTAIKSTNCKLSDLQRAAVIQEMDRILNHPSFKNSERCLKLFRRIIDHALQGDEEGIKERTLGIEVFERDSGYDTSADPIVRRIANEIRKRLAQCYEEPNGFHPVRIHLTPGSYVPEFDFASGTLHADFASVGLEEGTNAIQQDAPYDPDQRSDPSSSRVSARRGKLILRWALLLCAFFLAALLCVGAGTSILYRWNNFSSAEYRAWKPLLDANAQVTVCVSDRNASIIGNEESHAAGNANSGTSQASFTPMRVEQMPSTPFADVQVAYAVVSRMSAFNRESRLRPSTELPLHELRERPIIVIGGTNNRWTPILLANLRYSLHYDPVTRDGWIQDSQNPVNRDWKVDGKDYSLKHSVDYAVVTRFFDKETGQWIMMLSGLGAHGTEAAGQLLTDSLYKDLIPSSIGPKGNFQIVLKTVVLDEDTASLQVLSVYVW